MPEIDPSAGDSRPILDRSRPLKIVLASLLFLVGVFGESCVQPTPGKSGPLSAVEREAALRRIAAEYAATGNLSQARNELDKLALANPAQLLVSLAEQDVNAGRPPSEVAPLARLAEALGSRSPKLIAYLTPTSAASPVPTSPTPAPATPIAVATATRPAASATPAATATFTAQPTASPTATPQRPRVQADNVANLRAGPGTNYPVIGQLRAGAEYFISARNANGDWWQLAWEGGAQAWVSGMVVRVLGPIDAVPVAKEIPTPPPSPTPAPPTATPQPAGPDFRLVNVRLWSVTENGGRYDGTSVHCGEKHELYVRVTDAAGAALNGVTVKGVYSGEERVTGSKGPGVAEIVLWTGEDVFIVRDVDGRSVTSDVARGLTTQTHAISDAALIAAGYCKPETCAHFRSQNGCTGHYSWDAVFQRSR